MNYKILRTILISCIVILCDTVSATDITEAVSSESSKSDNVSGNEVSFTYIGNAGFLINIGDKKIKANFYMYY